MLNKRSIQNAPFQVLVIIDYLSPMLSSHKVLAALNKEHEK